MNVMPSSVKRVRAGGNWGRVVGIVYSVRRRPRSPWSAVWSRVTAAMWLDVFREVTVAQRERRLARLAARDLARRQRMLLSFERCVPHLVRTGPEPWDAGPDWGVVSRVKRYPRPTLIGFAPGACLSLGLRTDPGLLGGR